MRSRAPRRALRGAAGVAVALALLEVVTSAELVNPTYLPPASTVLGTAAVLLVDPAFLVHVAGTLASWSLGILVAIAIAVPLGILLGSSLRSYLAGVTAVEFLRPIPSVALIPLAILLLGRGLDMRVALVAYASTWPILLNTIYGIRNVDPVARDTARAFGLSAAATAWSVSLPSATPFIYTGIRISAGIALIVAISCELIAGGGPGIGTFILANAQAGVPRELAYAAILVSGLLGLTINTALVAGEHRLFRWDVRIRSEA